MSETERNTHACHPCRSCSGPSCTGRLLKPLPLPPNADGPFVSGNWYFADIGNAEQASWLLWGDAVARRHLKAVGTDVSMSAVPV